MRHHTRHKLGFVFIPESGVPAGVISVAENSDGPGVRLRKARKKR